MTTFLGAEFRLETVCPIGLATLRVRFTQDPQVVSQTDPHDALNIDNYVLVGPAENYVVGSSNVVDDPQAVDLYLAAPLALGEWTLVANPNIVDENGAPFLDPTSLPFTVTRIATQDPVSGGALNDEVQNVLRKWFNPGLKGKNWDSVLAGLAAGVKINWDNAKLAFDQLYLSSASGIYLERRAGDQGQTKPADIAMPDELFRALTIISKTSKLTQDAILEVLEVFYGPQAVRATITSVASDVYVLEDGDELTLLIDERDAITVFFSREDFSRIGRATQFEVANVISRQLRERGSSAYAEVYITDEGGQAVRICSGRLGISSSIRVIGGKAQRRLLFPEQLYVDPGTAPTETWNITKSTTTPGFMKFQLATSSAVYDFQKLVEGDQVLIYGHEFVPLNRGTFRVQNVVWEYVGSSLIQSFEIDNAAGVVQSGLAQLTYDAILFHRPSKRTTYNELRHVLVSQSDGQVDIVIPATTQAVGREAGTGAYVKLRTALRVTTS